MIEMKDVTKEFAGKIAVSNLHLTIPDGKIFGFLGPNGAGKSTTIKMLTGILPIDQGSITVNGREVDQKSLDVKKMIGYVPDRSDIFLRLKGLEYLNFIADVYGVSAEDREERIAFLTQKFGIYEALGDHILTYSHGMRQKIVICGVLLHEPDVWVLDEPMTGLDPKSSFTLKEMMREHARKGKIVFFSSHVLEVVEQLCDEVAIINNGRMQFQGSMESMRQQFRENGNLESLFLELTQHG